MMKKRERGLRFEPVLDAVSGDVVIIQDPGHDYHPGDYAALLQPFEEVRWMWFLVPLPERAGICRPCMEIILQ